MAAADQDQQDSSSRAETAGQGDKQTRGRGFGKEEEMQGVGVVFPEQFSSPRQFFQPIGAGKRRVTREFSARRRQLATGDW